MSWAARSSQYCCFLPVAWRSNQDGAGNNAAWEMTGGVRIVDLAQSGLIPIAATLTVTAHRMTNIKASRVCRHSRRTVSTPLRALGILLRRLVFSTRQRQTSCYGNGRIRRIAATQTFVMAHTFVIIPRRVFLYTFLWAMGYAHLPPLSKMSPFPWGYGSHLKHGSLDPGESRSQTASRFNSAVLRNSRSWSRYVATSRTIARI